MSYTRVDYEDVEPVAGGLHFLRDPLDCDQLGVSVLDCEPGWSGKPHDHAEDGHEEVYVLVEGAATMTVDDEAVPLAAGEAIRVAADSDRQIHNGDAPSQFVIVGAP
ncbi:cupin domain-containing protein [Halonotius sp. F2-221B]|uniref:cupin domain-containing protein n=1 Tax=Halonotius sp. F2-221B TaxID=2731620 RepID=UPI00398B40CE